MIFGATPKVKMGIIYLRRSAIMCVPFSKQRLFLCTQNGPYYTMETAHSYCTDDQFRDPSPDRNAAANCVAP